MIDAARDGFSLLFDRVAALSIGKSIRDHVKAAKGEPGYAISVGKVMKEADGEPLITVSSCSRPIISSFTALNVVN